MITDNSGQHLHDRATRGEPLSADERGRLDTWYAAQDQAELAALEQAAEPSSIATLRAKIDAAVAQLRTIAEQIQRLTTENEGVRSQIAELQLKLWQKSTASRS